MAVLCIHSPHIASPPGAASPAPRACRLRLKLVLFVSLASSHSKHGLPRTATDIRRHVLPSAPERHEEEAERAQGHRCICGQD